MHKHQSFIFSIVLIGSITIHILPSVAHAQIMVTQRTSNLELKQLLDEGRRLVDLGEYNGAIAIYQQAATIQPRNASIQSGIVMTRE